MYYEARLVLNQYGQMVDLITLAGVWNFEAAAQSDICGHLSVRVESSRTLRSGKRSAQTASIGWNILIEDV